MSAEIVRGINITYVSHMNQVLEAALVE
jgi:hypothetical protein